MKKFSKVTLKKEYLSGMTPKEIAAKHGLTSKYIRQLATRHKWAAQRSEIDGKVTSIVAETEAEAILSLKRQEREDMRLLLEGARQHIAEPNPSLYKLETATTVMARAYERLYKSHGIADKVNLNDDPDKPMFLKVIW